MDKAGLQCAQIRRSAQAGHTRPPGYVDRVLTTRFLRGRVRHVARPFANSAARGATERCCSPRRRRRLTADLPPASLRWTLGPVTSPAVAGLRPAPELCARPPPDWLSVHLPTPSSCRAPCSAGSRRAAVWGQGRPVCSPPSFLPDRHRNPPRRADLARRTPRRRTDRGRTAIRVDASG